MRWDFRIDVGATKNVLTPLTPKAKEWAQTHMSPLRWEDSGVLIIDGKEDADYWIDRIMAARLKITAY